ncbi:protein of unknown function [Methylococcus capsulatus]|uniref:Uncharacterized protein n=1 Tax=Methylococcus capsulatus TaxID=414 RepID=A0AA35UKW2_METCP|nr:protein of unknown function [Methylococcus capsulatus]
MAICRLLVERTGSPLDPDHRLAADRPRSGIGGGRTVGGASAQARRDPNVADRVKGSVGRRGAGTGGPSAGGVAPGQWLRQWFRRKDDRPRTLACQARHSARPT